MMCDLVTYLFFFGGGGQSQNVVQFSHTPDVSSEKVVFLVTVYMHTQYSFNGHFLGLASCCSGVRFSKVHNSDLGLRLS